MKQSIKCRSGCGACCIAPSITGPIPGMPGDGGKPAGLACVNLDPVTRECRIWGGPDYPGVCRDFAPSPEICGGTMEEAMGLLAALEEATRPGNY